MKACPIAFQHPSEAQQLHGIGPKLCDWLITQLKEHCEENDLPMPEIPRKGRKRQSGEALQPDGDNDDEIETAPRAAKKPRKQKEYVPALRSGPYAIVRALSSLNRDETGGLSKTHLINLAQPFCDSSFSVPSEPGKFYTAWNSHKTLLDKDLIYAFGRPTKKYALTDGGWEVTKRIEIAEGRQEQDATLQPTTASNSQTREGSTRAPAAGMLSDFSITDLQKELQRRQSASQLQDGTQAKVANIATNRSLITEAAAAEKKTPMQEAAERRKVLARAPIVDLSSPPPTPPRREHLRISSSPAPMPAQTVTSAIQKHQPSVPLTCPEFTPIVIEPSWYSLQLVIDTREIRTVSDRDYIAEELRNRGITPVVRSLEIGDCLWVAKLRPEYVDRMRLASDGGDEIMLDHIVERKRLDDLVGSITDGRFTEQKFRLRRSGVKQVYYLIEDITLSAEKQLRFGEAIDSAIASSIVVDGFFVNRTRKLDDTIAWLARMTKILEGSYRGKALHVIPLTALPSHESYLPLLKHLGTTRPETPHYVSFDTFSGMASKSDSLTLRDAFLKMLMCTKGMTAEKSIALQRIWHTPRAFIEAFEAGTAKSREELVLKKMGNLVGRKKIGKSLSVKLAEVWGEP
ncbi:Crossover junction endonuclease mus81 [Agyrium rufum]|nr:Crossover junction endonuclease mus81 [Agyrium rufum]